jgi:hypothetical protein
MTQTHSKSCANDFPTEFKEDWEWIVMKLAVRWNQFYETWIEYGTSKKMPVHFVRFEDLTTKATESAKSVLEFMMGVETLDGTYLGK